MMTAYWFVVRRFYVLSAIITLPWIIFLIVSPPSDQRRIQDVWFIAVATAIPLNIVLMYGSSKRWRSLRPGAGETVVHSETWASGYRKSRWSNIPVLGRRRSPRLIVQVTGTRIFVRPYWFLQASAGDILETLQSIPIAAVSKCERMGHESVLLEWSEEGELKNLVLSLRDPRAFQTALGPQFAQGAAEQRAPLTFEERYLQGP